MEKKDSIFSSLAPASPAAPFPAGKPAVSDQEVSALKHKIEAMEKNIVSELEKRISETRSAPPPPLPPNMNPQFLLAKIAELDKKLEAFTTNAMMSSAQLRNVEESRVSAHREIEGLLKVVREQQKYSEMDRQMHDQLEKSWHRVEDLEKRLMDFYSSTMHKSAEEGRLTPPLLAGDVEKIVDARFQKFLADVDLRFRAVTEKLDVQSPVLMRKTEDRISATASDLDDRLTAFEIEFRKLYLTISSSEESIRALYAGIKSEMLATLKDSLREEHAAITSHIDSFILDIEERMDSMSKLVLSHADQLVVQADQAETQLKKMEAEAGITAQKARSDLAALGIRIEEIFSKSVAETGARIQAESAKNADRIMEFSRLSAYSLSGTASLAGTLSELSGRLETLRDRTQAFTNGFKNVKLEALLGVSGALARKNFEGLQLSLEEMTKELAFFEAQKTEIIGNLKAMTEKSEGQSGKGTAS